MSKKHYFLFCDDTLHQSYPDGEKGKQQVIDEWKNLVEDSGYDEDELLIIHGTKFKAVPPVGEWSIQEVTNEEG